MKIGLVATAITKGTHRPQNAAFLIDKSGAMAPRVQALSTRAYENMVRIVMANPNGENAGCSCAFSPICWDQASTTRCCWLTIKRKACSAQNLIWTRCGTTGKPR